MGVRMRGATTHLCQADLIVRSRGPRTTLKQRRVYLERKLGTYVYTYSYIKFLAGTARAHEVENSVHDVIGQGHLSIATRPP